MAKYLIPFPGAAMVAADDEWNAHTRDDAIQWAARMAQACRCSQDLRVFHFDPQS